MPSGMPGCHPTWARSARPWRARRTSSSTRWPRALKAALAQGATRVTLTLGDVDAANAPVPAAPREPTDFTDGLSRLIADVERELGGSLATLPRAEKQHAVRLLEERGAFEMRRSAETVAEALGLTRFTVYNYLEPDPRAAAEPAG